MQRGDSAMTTLEFLPRFVY